MESHPYVPQRREGPGREEHREGGPRARTSLNASSLILQEGREGHKLSRLFCFFVRHLAWKSVKGCFAFQSPPLGSLPALDRENYFVALLYGVAEPAWVVLDFGVQLARHHGRARNAVASVVDEMA